MFPTLRRTPGESKSADSITWTTPTGQMPDWLGGRRRRWPVERAVYGAYERTVWLWRGVSFIAGHAARVPFAYRMPGSDATHDDHPLVRLLQPHSQVNPLEKARAFKRRLFIQVLLSDRGAFVELTRSRGGDIIRLDLLPPHKTKPVPTATAVHGRTVANDRLISHFEVRMPDGSVRQLAPEQVWWIREPHPLDPYRADTFLGSLGASVEMDELGRQINVNWMLNDGQVKAVVGIKGGLSAEESRRLEARFGRSPVDAGKVTVVNADQVTYADVSARPKDMQYQELARNAKEEILGGLGVPESLLGISKGSTFDNAAQDKFNFWSETMPGPLDLVAAELVDPRDKRDLEPFFDLSGIEALQLPQRAQREEARAEVAAGLRTIESYAELAGYEVFSTPQTRALWLPNTGRQEIPQTAEDVQEAEHRQQEMAALLQAAGPEPNEDAGETSASRAAGGGREPRAAGRGGTGPAARTGRGAEPVEGADAAAAGKQVVVARYQVKTVEVVRDVDTSMVGQQAAEDGAVAALSALAVRWAARTHARLRSPKARKGTRHWTPDPSMPADRRAGAKALDMVAVVDPEGWEQDAVDTLAAILDQAAVAAAVTGTATLTGAAAGGTGAAAATAGALAVSQAALDTVATAVREQAARVAVALSAADTAGGDLGALVAVVNAAELVSWAKTVAAHAAATVVTGGLHAAGEAARLAGFEVTATWKTLMDDRVRPSHRVANGQSRTAGVAFTVGGALLRFPRDPAGPVAETINCRCGVRLSASVRRASAGWLP